MSDSADLRLSSYNFHLPEECIAQRPVEPRHAARLLTVEAAGVGPAPHARHLSVWDLQQELRQGDLLVVNNTRVLRARLEGAGPVAAPWNCWCWSLGMAGWASGSAWLNPPRSSSLVIDRGGGRRPDAAAVAGAWQ